jgi:hypothetical protein
MVQVVHLVLGEQPPKGERFVLIERCRPGGRTTVEHSRSGTLVKVPAPFLLTEISAFSRMADQAGITKLYVKGANDEVPSELVAGRIVSPWAA